MLHLLDALAPLITCLRYGSVRQIERSQIAQIVAALLTRVTIGLPTACRQIKQEAAQELLRRIDVLHLALATEQDAGFSASWLACLQNLAQMAGVHPLLQGRAQRLLLDAQAISSNDLAQHLALALSTPQVDFCAAWVEGLLAGSGLLLLHDEALWEVLDQWLQQLREEEFIRVLPLLRRSFSQFAQGERQMLNAKARQTPNVVESVTRQFDPARAQQMLGLARTMLGLSDE
jgi:hypothetical protein